MSRRWLRQTVSISLGSLLLAAAGQAVTITPLPLGDRWVGAFTDSRDVTNNTSVVDNDEVSSFDWSVPYDETVSASVVGSQGGTLTATASQQSNVTATTVVALLATSVAADTVGYPLESGSADAIALLNLAFTIDEPAQYDLSGVLDAGGVGFGREVNVWLHETSGSIVTIVRKTTSGPFDFHGALQPGQYGLVVELMTFAIGDVDAATASAEATFVVSEVPAPGTALLLGGGLIGCAMARRLRLPVGAVG